jgi:hypothetical protein
MSRTICLDFDGVLHWYRNGFIAKDVIDDVPVPGAAAFCHELIARGYEVKILTTRASGYEDGFDCRAIVAWLERFGFPRELEIVTEKPKAVLYVDDRGFRFNGDFSAVLDALDRGVEPWNRGDVSEDRKAATVRSYELRDPEYARQEIVRICTKAALFVNEERDRAPHHDGTFQRIVDIVGPVDGKFARGDDAGVCISLAAFLVAKNAAYGNSIFDPVRVLATVPTEELIRVRIDDKLSRIKRGSAAAKAEVSEDTVLDLAGYFVLYLVSYDWNGEVDTASRVLGFLVRRLAVSGWRYAPEKKQ